MPRRLWALAAAVVASVVCAGAGDAHAQRRPVAVIDLSGEPAVEKLAKDLERELNSHPALSQVPDSTLSAELIGKPADDDARRLADAKAALDRAFIEVDAFEFPASAVRAAAAETALSEVSPSLAVAGFADLAFLYGRIRFGEGLKVEYAEQFALSYRLAPGRVLDRAKILPEEVAAWEAAQIPVAGTATLTVKGTGKLWVDGKELGPAGPPVEVVPGLHVVALSGPDRETRTKLVRAAAGTAQTIEIPDAPASDRLKVRRARLVLRAAPDAAARASAMTQLATLVGVRDAVLLGMTNGKVTVQTWRDVAPGFSPRRDVNDATPADILEALAPKPKPIVITPRPRVVPKPPPYVPVYRRRWVQLSAVGVLAAAVGSFLLIRSIPDGRMLNPMFDPAPVAR